MEKRFRHEYKYIINSGFYHILRQRLKAAMRPDPNGENGVYRITSLYFDDIYRSAYNDKALGLDSRKKYRVRYYDLSPELIRLEVKEKKGDMVSKRSSRLSVEEYKMLLDGKRHFLKEKGSAAEEFYISDRAVKLSPSVLADYRREAYVCRAGNVRITFDTELKTSPQLDALCGSSEFYSVFENGEIILEVKYDSFIPSHIQALLSGIPITRESVSKFVLCTDKSPEAAKCAFGA